MKLVTNKFKLGGLHEKHVVAKWILWRLCTRLLGLRVGWGIHLVHVWVSIWLPSRDQLRGCPQLHGLYTTVFISRGVISVELKRRWNKPGMAGFKILPWDICLEQVIKQWNTSALMTGLGWQNSNLGLLAHETRMLTSNTGHVPGMLWANVIFLRYGLFHQSFLCS